MSEFFLELFSEEIPARLQKSFREKILDDFKTFFNKGLQESWSLDEYQNRDLSNPVSFGGYIVVGDLDGYIHLINPLNGQTIGRKKISKHAIKTLISRSKNFYAVDESFNLYSLSI